MIKYIPEWLGHSSLCSIYIYELVDPRNMCVRYIGKTKNLKTRYASHLSSLNKNTHKNNWIKKLLRLQLKPIMRPVAIVKESEANLVEIDLISKTSNLTNMTGGGDGQHLISKETRIKISNTKKGKPGHKPSESVLAARRKRVVATCILSEIQICFASIKDAASFIGGDSASSISKVCGLKSPKKYSTCKGYTWRYLEASHGTKV